MRIAALAPDLFFAAKIGETLRSAGHEVEVVSTPDAAAAAESADVVLADLHTEGLDPGAFVASLRGSPVLGFYSHVDAGVRDRAQAAGFDVVVPRSRLAREMPELVAGLVRSRR